MPIITSYTNVHLQLKNCANKSGTLANYDKNTDG